MLHGMMFSSNKEEKVMAEDMTILDEGVMRRMMNRK